MSDNRLLALQNLSRRFGSLTAVDDLSFAVERGEVLGFLGPNGSGKTTTMRMVTGFLPPTSGRAIVCGFDVTNAPLEVKRRVGYLPEGAPLYGDMTPLELLAFVADVRGLQGVERRRRIDEVVGRLMLGEVQRQPIETLSKGFKRRVGLAQAILHDPQVLILDEPTDGLDPNQKHEVRGLLRELAGGKAIVISTHILEEIEAICTRAIVIARGRIVADETPETLLARSLYRHAVRLRISEEQVAEAEAALRAADLSLVESGQLNGRHFIVASLGKQDDGRDIETVAQAALAQRKLDVQAIYRERPRLDDVFRSLTTE